MHLSHRSTCADEDCHSTWAQFTTIAHCAIGRSNILTVVSNERNVIIMKPTEVNLHETIQRFGANHIQCSAASDEKGCLSHCTRRIGIEYDNIIKVFFR